MAGVMVGLACGWLDGYLGKVFGVVMRFQNIVDDYKLNVGDFVVSGKCAVGFTLGGNIVRIDEFGVSVMGDDDQWIVVIRSDFDNYVIRG